MKFLADMGVSPKAVAWLRSDGHDAVHLRERGAERMADADIFALAATEGRIVVTFDLDFGEIVASAPAGAGLASVIVFRLRNTRTGHVIDRFRQVLAQSSDMLAQGAIVLVDDSRHRVRRLPIDRVGL